MKNFIKKSILYSGIILAVFAVNLQARQFEVHIKDADQIQTRTGNPITEIMRVIDIRGHENAPEIPTYGQIRKGIAEAFNLDPNWKTFMIKYIYVTDSKVYNLKPYIENISRKERAAFFDDLAQNSYQNIPVLLITKRPAAMQNPTEPAIYREPNEGETEPEIQIEEDFIIPRWMFDEDSLVGESDPTLIKTLQQEIR